MKRFVHFYSNFELPSCLTAALGSCGRPQRDSFLFNFASMEEQKRMGNINRL